MPDPDPATSLWKRQTEEEFTMSLSDIHTRAQRFQSRVQRRNISEYLAGAVVVGAFGLIALAADPWPTQLGAALVMLGALYVCWRLSVVGSAAGQDAGAHAESWADFHRGELMRQRDALRGVWRWYLGPLAPGLVLFWIGTGMKLGVAIAAGGLGVAGIVFWWIGVMNAQAAHTLQGEIDALDRARTSK